MAPGFGTLWPRSKAETLHFGIPVLIELEQLFLLFCCLFFSIRTSSRSHKPRIVLKHPMACTDGLLISVIFNYMAKRGTSETHAFPTVGGIDCPNGAAIDASP